MILFWHLISPKNTQGKEKERKNRESEEEERKGREKGCDHTLLVIIILILLICSKEQVYILAVIFLKIHRASYDKIISISVYWVGLCLQLLSNKTGRKQTCPVISAAVVAIKKCFWVLKMNFDSRNKVVYRDDGSETSRDQENYIFVLRLIFRGVCSVSAVQTMCYSKVMKYVTYFPPFILKSK